ncbi:MAG: hypothetical protein TREMPRED_002625 [Tremellales sp. Tagirdzhanova-0007]|nr:MAG: hypothetical protein TREMPRED_002625 [Tremellales sp. Tagirdzhanova-0007]
MFSKILISLALVSTALGQLTISTPASLVECQPAAITFSGGTGPYILAAIPGGQVSAVALETITSALTASPYTWLVNLASGTNVTLRLTDSTGAIQYSSPEVIQPGSTTSCLNTTASTSGVATAGAITTTGSSAAGTLSMTTSAASTTSMTSLSSSGAAAAGASSAAASSAASSAGSSSAAAAGTSSAAQTTSASTPVASAASSAAATSAAATSAASAASTASKAGSLPTALAGVPAIAVGVLGGLAVLL